MFAKKSPPTPSKPSDDIDDNLRQKIKKVPAKGTLVFIAICGLVTFGLGLSIAAYSFVNYRYERVPEGQAQTQIFEVKRGTGLSQIANDLERTELIDSADIFKLVTKFNGGEANFKAGEFEITTPINMRGIYETLSEGKAVLYPVTIPEGRTTAQVMNIFANVPTLINDNPVVPQEGTLLPETFLTPRNMTYSQLLAQMRADQEAVLDELWAGRQKDLPIRTRQEAVILASIVEKETGISGERDKVAGVFINRLRLGMRLESDPTIIYGLTKGEPLGRGIRRSEIDRKTDWNTYQIDGLPITPICNPGREAIAAVLNPAETEAIFFVADGTGGHVFAKTLAEHNRNVRQWRQIERARKRRSGGG